MADCTAVERRRCLVHRITDCYECNPNWPRSQIDVGQVLDDYNDSILLSSDWSAEKRHEAADRSLRRVPALAYEIFHLREDMAHAQAALAAVQELADRWRRWGNGWVTVADDIEAVVAASGKEGST
ncbi:MAG TPA: hypothetical protein VGP44_10700 [Gemmatimonadales bacterium]|nr:hypothetical protein [Gemmatimonadales bacterium]